MRLEENEEEIEALDDAEGSDEDVAPVKPAAKKAESKRAAALSDDEGDDAEPADDAENAEDAEDAADGDEGADGGDADEDAAAEVEAEIEAAEDELAGGSGDEDESGTAAGAGAGASSGSGAEEKKSKVVIKGMSKKKLEKFKADMENRGVVYLSRVWSQWVPLAPSCMAGRYLLRYLRSCGLKRFGTCSANTAQSVVCSSLLKVLWPFCCVSNCSVVQHSPCVCRLDASVARKRKKSGGNTGKRFIDGWVEFADKKVAKSVARSLNNTQIGTAAESECCGSACC